MSFDSALKLTLGFEGGFSDDPDDLGGRTNFGITQKTYRAWRKFKGQAPQDVSEITRQEVHDIYHEWYWIAGHCQSLPHQIGMAHFDACVNHGTHNAARILQSAIGVRVDGKIGGVTLSAVQASVVTDGTAELLSALLFARLEFYDRIVRRNASQGKFLLGWLGRVLTLRRDLQLVQPDPTPHLRAA